MVEQLVQIGQRLEFVVNRPVPFAKVEAGGDVFVNSREMPVAKEFGDIGKLITETGKINADFAQFAQDRGAPPGATGAQVAVSPFERMVQEPVVGFQFRQLQIRQLHDVQRLIKI